MKKLFIALLLMDLFSSCQTPADGPVSGTPVQLADTLPAWMKDAVIYEVNLRQFTPEGTFRAFRRHLPRLKELGVDVLWFMPVFPISEAKRKGSLGSFYAVGDTRSINPAYGTLPEFKEMVREIQAMGMRVVLDWVPNHTGWDHPWITEHPDFYSHDPQTDTIVHPPGTDWTDVAALNYNNPALADAMISEMAYWVTEAGIDGFRCDQASKVPLDFWRRATPALLQVKPDLFLLAESEDPALTNEHLFHADYGWKLHHLMNGIAQGQKTPEDLLTYFREDEEVYKAGNHLLFTSNHDENSWQGTEAERLGQAAEVMYVLCATLPGIPLIYSGQEEPLLRRLAFFEKDDIGFGKYGYTGFFKILNVLRNSNPAIWAQPFGGAFEVLETGNPKTLAYRRESGDDRLLVLLNLSDQVQETGVDVGDWTGTFRDVFRNTTAAMASPVNVQIGPWGYLVLSNR